MSTPRRCSTCRRLESEVPFYASGGLCKACAADYQREYKRRRREDECAAASVAGDVPALTEAAADAYKEQLARLTNDQLANVALSAAIAAAEAARDQVRFLDRLTATLRELRARTHHATRKTA